MLFSRFCDGMPAAKHKGSPPLKNTGNVSKVELALNGARDTQCMT